MTISILLIVPVLLATVSAELHFASRPSFLEKLTKEEKKEFFDIAKGRGLKIGEIDEKKLAFAEKHGFGDVIKKEIAEKKENEEKIKVQRPKLIGELQSIHDQLLAIHNNSEQTKEEMNEAVEKLREKYANAVDTLNYMSRIITGHRMRHPRILPNL